MGDKTNPMKQVFLLFILFALVQPIFAQETENINSTRPVLAENQNPSYGQEDILVEAQRSFDRSIDILNMAVTLMGVLVGLITIILIIVIACGAFEYNEWKSLREGIEDRASELEIKSERVKRDINDIREHRETAKKAEEDIINLREGLKNRVPPLTEKPTKEIEEKLDEFFRKSEILEMLGASLTADDYFNRATDLYYKGKHDESLTAIEKAIELKPDLAYAWNNKGITLGKLGRYDEALTAFEKAIELKPDLAYAWDNKGYVLSKLGRYDEDLKAIEKAIELKPDLANAWYNKAYVYSLKGDKVNALKNLSKAIELDAKYKEDAKKDEDFKEFWDDEDFKKIVSNPK